MVDHHLFSFSSDLVCFQMITQLLDSDWPANILAGLNLRAQENGLMSPDGVHAISMSLAGHKTIVYGIKD